MIDSERRTTSGWLGVRLASLLAITLSVMVCAHQSLADDKKAPAFVVNCYDEARGSISRIAPDACKGRIIDDQEAEKIKSARTDRLRAIMARREQPPLFPGKQRYSIGTGFFISESGLMLSNRHVIDKCAALSVETTTGEIVAAKLLAIHDTHDLALLQASMKATGVAQFRRGSPIELSGRTDLIGYPTQGIAPVQPFFTPAVMASSLPTMTDNSRFLIHGDVRGGNSGGPVLDADGHVAGVIYAQLNTVAVYQRTGKVPEETGVAISNDVVLGFLRSNGIEPPMAAMSTPRSREEVFEQARTFVARIGCWR